MCTNPCPFGQVSYNGSVLPVKDFQAYVDMYLGPKVTLQLGAVFSLGEEGNGGEPTWSTATPRGTRFCMCSKPRGPPFCNPCPTDGAPLLPVHAPPQDSGPPRFYERVNERWEVVISVSDGQFQQVSFVNSICTSKGGTHVNAVEGQVTKSLLELMAKKHKQVGTGDGSWVENLV